MKYWILISSIVLFTVILVINLNRDYRYWLKHRATNHNNRFWIRMWCLIPAAIGFLLFKTGYYISEWWQWISLLYLSIASLMIAFAWANLFSGIRNKLCGETWHFAGSDGPEDGDIENLIQKYPWLQWVKVVAGIAFITLYTIL